MIDCTEAVRQLWDFLENDLEADDRDNVEEHLSFCRTCCGEVRFAEELRDVMKDTARAHVPDDVAKRMGDLLDELEESQP